MFLVISTINSVNFVPFFIKRFKIQSLNILVYKSRQVSSLLWIHQCVQLFHFFAQLILRPFFIRRIKSHNFFRIKIDWNHKLIKNSLIMDSSVNHSVFSCLSRIWIGIKIIHGKPHQNPRQGFVEVWRFVQIMKNKGHLDGTKGIS